MCTLFLGDTCNVLPDIPMISRQAMQTLQLAHRFSMQNHHSKGDQKQVPPKVTLECGLPYDLLCRSNNSVQTALEKDISRLVSILLQTEIDDLKPEWAGAMVASSRAEGSGYGPASHFIFGPQIDRHPSHPDTILTTLMLLEKSLKTTPYLHLSADYATVQSY